MADKLFRLSCLTAGFGLNQSPSSSSSNKTICPFEFLQRDSSPTRVEDGKLQMNRRFLEYSTDTLPPTNQKKVIHPAVLTPNFVFEIFPPNCRGSLGNLSPSHPFSMLGPFNKSFFVPKRYFGCLASVCQGTQTWVEQPRHVFVFEQASYRQHTVGSCFLIHSDNL